jgi:osmotically-inducible protein OsmY
MSKTNAELQQDVLSELKYEPSVDASEIGVTADEGIVSLMGSVKTYAEEWAAVRAAERVAGVKAVTDELKVELPGSHVRNDQDVARAAINALKWDIRVPNERIKVKVAEGWITLDGNVDFKYEQTAAEEAVRRLIGVKGVMNLIAIEKPPVTSAEIKDSIDSALRRAAEVDGKNITVTVVRDKVTLTGNVSSLAERQQAEHAAWSAPGIRTVEDQLVIAD